MKVTPDLGLKSCSIVGALCINLIVSSKAVFVPGF